MKFNTILKEVQGVASDLFIFTRKNNKFASKDYGKLDKNQYHNPPKTDDVKDYKKCIKNKKAYLTKVNVIKVKI
jgi:hypothetical protein